MGTNIWKYNKNLYEPFFFFNVFKRIQKENNEELKKLNKKIHEKITSWENNEECKEYNCVNELINQNEEWKEVFLELWNIFIKLKNENSTIERNCFKLINFLQVFENEVAKINYNEEKFNSIKIEYLLYFYYLINFLIRKNIIKQKNSKFIFIEQLLKIILFDEYNNKIDNIIELINKIEKQNIKIETNFFLFENNENNEKSYFNFIKDIKNSNFEEKYIEKIEDNMDILKNIYTQNTIINIWKQNKKQNENNSDNENNYELKVNNVSIKEGKFNYSLSIPFYSFINIKKLKPNINDNLKQYNETFFFAKGNGTSQKLFKDINKNYWKYFFQNNFNSFENIKINSVEKINLLEYNFIDFYSNNIVIEKNKTNAYAKEKGYETEKTFNTMLKNIKKIDNNENFIETDFVFIENFSITVSDEANEVNQEINKIEIAKKLKTNFEFYPYKYLDENCSLCDKLPSLVLLLNYVNKYWNLENINKRFNFINENKKDFHRESLFSSKKKKTFLENNYEFKLNDLLEKCISSFSEDNTDTNNFECNIFHSEDKKELTNEEKEELRNIGDKIKENKKIIEKYNYSFVKEISDNENFDNNKILIAFLTSDMNKDEKKENYYYYYIERETNFLKKYWEKNKKQGEKEINFNKNFINEEGIIGNKKFKNEKKLNEFLKEKGPSLKKCSLNSSTNKKYILKIPTDQIFIFPDKDSDKKGVEISDFILIEYKNFSNFEIEKVFFIAFKDRSGRTSVANILDQQLRLKTLIETTKCFFGKENNENRKKIKLLEKEINKEINNQNNEFSFKKLFKKIGEKTYKGYYYSILLTKENEILDSNRFEFLSVYSNELNKNNFEKDSFLLEWPILLQE